MSEATDVVTIEAPRGIFERVKTALSALRGNIAPLVNLQLLQQVPSTSGGAGGWFGVVRESFAGAFQRHIQIDAPRNILAFSAVFSCVTGIASDIAKLWTDLVEEDDDEICTRVVSASPYWAVLRKPNRFQTRFQFWEQWIISKLLYGNTYAIKERDQRGIVTAMYILDAQRVKPLVAEDGGVYYELSIDHLSGLSKNVTVPASEIIHDRMNCLWHPLVGVSPIYACGLSATMGNRIQANSTKFFGNMSRPSGMLLAPGKIDDVDANRLKTEWETNFGGANIGRVAVLGSGLKYEAMAVPAVEAQLIEQLKWTVEDVARAFRYPLYKLGGAVPVGSTVESLNLGYYCDCLQPMIEAAEASLDDGLGLRDPKVNYYTQFDIEGLIRMDRAAQMTMLADSVKGSIRAPNEARAKINLKPVAGGNSPMAQQQNFSLAALEKRDAQPDPFETKTPPARAPDDDAENDAQAAAARQTRELINAMESEAALLEAEAEYVR